MVNDGKVPSYFHLVHRAEIRLKHRNDLGYKVHDQQGRIFALHHCNERKIVLFYDNEGTLATFQNGRNILDT